MGAKASLALILVAIVAASFGTYAVGPKQTETRYIILTQVSYMTQTSTEYTTAQALTMVSPEETTTNTLQLEESLTLDHAWWDPVSCILKFEIKNTGDSPVIIETIQIGDLRSSGLGQGMVNIQLVPGEYRTLSSAMSPNYCAVLTTTTTISPLCPTYVQLITSKGKVFNFPLNTLLSCPPS